MPPTPKRACRRTRWTSLPTPLRSVVFSYLTPKEVFFPCRLVCAQWRNSRASWSSLALSGTAFLEAEAVVRASEHSLVRDAIVDCSTVCLVSELPRLERVELKKATDEALRFLTELHELQILALPDSNQVSDAGLQHLGAVRSLQELKFTANWKVVSGVSDEGLRYLSALSELRNLDLTSCWMTSEGLKHLAACVDLEQLILWGCERITAEGLSENLRSLSVLRELRTLNLGYTFVTDDGLLELSPLIGLRTLDLSGCKLITDEGLRHVGSLIRLEELTLAWSSVKDEGLQHISALRALSKLDLLGCDVTDEGLRHVSVLPALHTLDLRYCERVTDEGLHCVSTSKSLRVLYFLQQWGTNVTSTCMRCLKNLFEVKTDFLITRPRVGGAPML